MDKVLIDKLIKMRYVEIVVVLVLVFLTIPIWDSIEQKLSNENIVLLDEYNNNFNRALNNYFLVKNQGQFYKISKIFSTCGLF